MNKPTGRIIAVAAGACAFALAGVLFAQAPGIQRTIVAKADVSVPGREAVVASVEIAPGGVADWHTHPGDEATLVIQGEIEVFMAGKPAHTYKGGEGFVIPAGTVHSAKNHATAPVKLAGVYFVEKGKPLASPAPAPAQ